VRYIEWHSAVGKQALRTGTLANHFPHPAPVSARAHCVGPAKAVKKFEINLAAVWLPAVRNPAVFSWQHQKKCFTALC